MIEPISENIKISINACMLETTLFDDDDIEPRSVEKYQHRAYWPKWKDAIPIELVSLTKQKGIWVRSANVPECKAYWT